MFTFIVIPKNKENVSFEVTADSNHICEWEAKNRLNSLTALYEHMRMTELRMIAHIAARREGVFPGSLEEFIETHRIVVKENVKALDRDELVETIALAMLDNNDPEPVADRVMDLLESLQTRKSDPTRPAH